MSRYPKPQRKLLSSKPNTPVQGAGDPPARLGVPIGALELNEDIKRMEEALRLLMKVEPGNVTADPNFGRIILDATTTQIRACLRYSKLKMRQDYL